MNKVRVDKNKLTEIVVENRKRHLEESLVATVEYWDALVKYYENCLENAKNRSDDKNGVAPKKVEIHIADYDRAVRMLELSVDDTIMLEDYEFSQFVLDEWEWKKNFLVSSSFNKTYLGK